ncbi:hypothetical protein D9M71_429860 [compost metagenome]
MSRTSTVRAKTGLAELPGRAFAHPGCRRRIAEQHRRVTVLRIDDLGVRVGSDQQAILQASRLHEPFEHIEAIHIARAP